MAKYLPDPNTFEGPFCRNLSLDLILHLDGTRTRHWVYTGPVRFE